MKAMLIDENKNFVWTDVPEPVLADDGVIVEIHATALNLADLLQREGKYPSPAGWPSWAGLEPAGRIIAVGKTTERESDLGAAMPFMARGGYWVVISTLAGVETNVKLRPLLTKGLHLVGSMLRNRTNDQKHEILQSLSRDVWKYFEDGTIKPSTYKVFDIPKSKRLTPCSAASKTSAKSFCA